MVRNKLTHTYQDKDDARTLPFLFFWFPPPIWTSGTCCLYTCKCRHFNQKDTNTSEFSSRSYFLEQTPLFLPISAFTSFTLASPKGGGFSVYPAWSLPTLLNLEVYVFHQFLENTWQLSLQIFLLPHCLSLILPGLQFINVLKHFTMSHLSLLLSIFFPLCDSVWLFSLGPTLSPLILSSAAPGELLDLAREVFNIRHNIFRFQNI